jgi:hypothetical protein
MKVISNLQAATVIQALWDEIRPVDGSAFAATLQAMKDRYKFQMAGQSPVGQQIGLTTPIFQTGEFRTKDEIFPINQIEFQPLGIFITCATTEQNEAVISDVFDFLGSTFKYRRPPDDRPRSYNSIIIAEMSASFDKLFEPWRKVQTTLNKFFGEGPEATPSAIRFLASNEKNEPQPDRQYAFERRLQAPIGLNWYFSQAPLTTEKHIELLKIIEREIGK